MKYASLLDMTGYLSPLQRHCRACCKSSLAASCLPYGHDACVQVSTPPCTRSQQSSLLQGQGGCLVRVLRIAAPDCRLPQAWQGYSIWLQSSEASLALATVQLSKEVLTRPQVMSAWLAS